MGSILLATLSFVAWGSWTSHELVDPVPWVKIARFLLLHIDTAAPLCKANGGSAPSSGPARGGTLYVVHLNEEFRSLASAE